MSTSGVPGLGGLIDDYCGVPPTLRWLSINPDGRVVERTSDNQIAWSTLFEIWVQHRLVRDVYREVDPSARGFGVVADMIRAGEHGVVVAAGRAAPSNPVATRMLTELGITHEVHGTIAWIGPAHPDTGLHADLDDDRRAALVALAERCRAGKSEQGGSS